MKKLILTYAILFLSMLTNAQLISPIEDNEYCPDTEYSFTISGLPGNFSSLDAGSIYVYQLQVGGDNKTVTFKAKFNDVNSSQTITYIMVVDYRSLLSLRK